MLVTRPSREGLRVAPTNQELLDEAKNALQDLLQGRLQSWTNPATQETYTKLNISALERLIITLEQRVQGDNEGGGLGASLMGFGGVY